MIPFALPLDRAPRILCLGAHSDDIEIGCAGTLLQWARQRPEIEVMWVVLSAAGERAAEARRSAKALLPKQQPQLVIAEFPDGHLPSEFPRAKAFLAGLRERFVPDVVFSHRLEDRHQDHRLIAELAWQLWRDQLILEYEIPKWEGDLGLPNLYVPLDKALAERKLRHLIKHFGTQRSKGWFNEEVFRSLMTIRGIECRAESGLAEAFHLRKAVLRFGS